MATTKTTEETAAPQLQETIEGRYIAAWKAIENPPLDGKNPHFGNKYATLKATLNVIREACAPHGIAYRQRLHKNDEGNFELISFVMDDSGHELECSTFPVETPPNPQSFGSNMTYAKRQQAQADWGITGEEDDDGNAGAEAAKNAQQSTRSTTSRGGTQRAAKSQQKAPSDEYKQPNEEDRRAKYLARINELTATAIQMGIKPEGIDDYIEATFHGVPLEELQLPQLAVVGKHLAQVIEDKETLNNG